MLNTSGVIIEAIEQLMANIKHRRAEGWLLGISLVLDRLCQKKYCATLDQGTIGTRLMIFDHESNVIAWKYLEHEQKYPKPGWVEHDPMEIVDRMNDVIRLALEEAKIDPSARVGFRRSLPDVDR